MESGVSRATSPSLTSITCTHTPHQMAILSFFLGVRLTRTFLSYTFVTLVSITVISPVFLKLYSDVNIIQFSFCLIYFLEYFSRRNQSHENEGNIRPEGYILDIGG
jgi:hypothetical protein